MKDEEMAEEYAEDYFGAYYPQEEERRAVEQAYLAGLHEGQKENNKLLDVINNQDVKIAELEQSNENLIEYIKELENKIADLEKENEQLRNNGFTVSAMTEQQLKVAIEKGEQLEKQLEQAKEIIKLLLWDLRNPGVNTAKDIEKAEHFLGRDKISREAEEFLKEDS